MVHGIEGEGEREREREREGSWVWTGTGGFVGACRVCKGERGREGEESFAGRL